MNNFLLFCLMILFTSCFDSSKYTIPSEIVGKKIAIVKEGLLVQFNDRQVLVQSKHIIGFKAEIDTTDNSIIFYKLVFESMDNHKLNYPKRTTVKFLEGVRVNGSSID